jgi:hypothetical protein
MFRSLGGVHDVATRTLLEYTNRVELGSIGRNEMSEWNAARSLENSRSRTLRMQVGDHALDLPGECISVGGRSVESRFQPLAGNLKVVNESKSKAHLVLNLCQRLRSLQVLQISLPRAAVHR